MKIGKKFLSLLMGVAVLLVSSLPAFAAEVETTDCASVSYDYVTEFDDGGKDHLCQLSQRAFPHLNYPLPTLVYLFPLHL